MYIHSIQNKRATPACFYIGSVMHRDLQMIRVE